MTQLKEELQSEGILREGPADRFNGRMRAAGQLYLTKKRLVFLQRSYLDQFPGSVVSAIAGALIKGRTLALDLPLSTVASVSQ